MNTRQTLCETLRANDFDEAATEIEQLRATLLNIQALAERGFPIDAKYLSMRCHAALAHEQRKLRSYQSENWRATAGPKSWPRHHADGECATKEGK